VYVVQPADVVPILNTIGSGNTGNTTLGLCNTVVGSANLFSGNIEYTSYGYNQAGWSVYLYVSPFMLKPPLIIDERFLAVFVIGARKCRSHSYENVLIVCALSRASRIRNMEENMVGHSDTRLGNPS
jgi:hypothetical protein